MKINYKEAKIIMEIIIVAYDEGLLPSESADLIRRLYKSFPLLREKYNWFFTDYIRK